MRQVFAALLVVAGLAAYPGGAAYAEVAVPPLKSRVTDLTGTLNAQQKGELESRIAAFEAKRGSQIAVLLLPTTKPEEIEQYAIRVAEAWKIGRKKVDDGLILVVAKDDRRLRIEVGYGLEGRIPDSAAKRVIDERITPRFRDGDFYGGVRDGVDQLIRLAEGEKLPAPAAAPAAPGIQFDPMLLVLFGFFFIVIAGNFLTRLLGPVGGSAATATSLGAVAWPFFGVWNGVVAAIIGFALTYANARSGKGGNWSSGGGSWSSGSSGGSSSSWGGGSSSSSGGFSGGGGSFGGGGASGSW